MENYSLDKNKENTIKSEFNLDKEKTRLNLRKNKLNNIISSKRKIISFNQDNDLIKKEYNINLEEIINNIPLEYKINITQFIDQVRYNK